MNAFRSHICARDFPGDLECGAMRVLLDKLRSRFGGQAPVPERAGPARVPDGIRVYAIGDIHGERHLLQKMLSAIEADAADHPPSRTVVVFLGDYIDRGPDSRGVLDDLTSNPLPGVSKRFLAGNHESAMLEFLQGSAPGIEWLRFGGVETLGSYEVSAAGAPTPARMTQVRADLSGRLPPRHLDFLHGLENSVVIGDYAFVHAGIRPGRPLEAQIPEDLLWIREPFLSYPRPHQHVVVHGHSVTAQPECLPNRIGLDTGAYATGVLSAIRLQDSDQRVIQVTR